MIELIYAFAWRVVCLNLSFNAFAINPEKKKEFLEITSFLAHELHLTPGVNIIKKMFEIYRMTIYVWILKD